ncbi:MAG TPA: dihydrofolate reductase family protein [Gemmatimonadaceae bacterium]|nr:dihydrofolate reductase family protein [Gemmatimonadaceae bacterium]
MKKVIVEAEVSLDGVTDAQSPEFWTQVFKFHSADVTEYLKNLLFTPDALLLGRQTYEAFAHVWPTRAGEEADRINAMPKYVASRSLKGPLGWNATLIEGDTANGIRKLKEQPGRDLLQYGVGELTQTMLQHGLVDEVRLIIFPFVVGRGPRVFETFDPMSLQLVDTKAFSSGAIALHYQPSQPTKD